MHEWLAILECGHTSVVSKYNKPATFCFRCREYREIREWTEGFAVRCLNCRYSRRYGVAEYTASRAMSAHHRSHPTHQVQTWLGSKLAYEVLPQSEQLSFEDAPPF